MSDHEFRKFLWHHKALLIYISVVVTVVLVLTILESVQ